MPGPPTPSAETAEEIGVNRCKFPGRAAINGRVHTYSRVSLLHSSALSLFRCSVRGTPNLGGGCNGRRIKKQSIAHTALNSSNLARLQASGLIARVAAFERDKRGEAATLRRDGRRSHVDFCRDASKLSSTDCARFFSSGASATSLHHCTKRERERGKVTRRHRTREREGDYE